MTSPLLRTASLLAATATMGFMAGSFALYAHAIMPGLRHTDDRTFVGAFQAIDRSIINPLFIGVMFLGALAFTAVAAASNRGEPAGRFALMALAAYGVAAAVTIVVNVPANDAIKAAGDPAHLADVAAVRAQFHEVRWAAWNLLRVVTTTAAFGCLLWSLVLHGRPAT